MLGKGHARTVGIMIMDIEAQHGKKNEKLNKPSLVIRFLGIIVSILMTLIKF